jgi:hypothetical protein
LILQKIGRLEPFRYRVVQKIKRLRDIYPNTMRVHRLLLLLCVWPLQATILTISAGPGTFLDAEETVQAQVYSTSQLVYSDSRINLSAYCVGACLGSFGNQMTITGPAFPGGCIEGLWGYVSYGAYPHIDNTIADFWQCGLVYPGTYSLTIKIHEALGPLDFSSTVLPFSDTAYVELLGDADIIDAAAPEPSASVVMACLLFAAAWSRYGRTRSTSRMR